MKRYERYKPSGVEWIGEIPDHWGLKKFGLISYMKGRIGWQGLRQAEFTNEGPYLITGMNFENGRIAWDKVYHISEERYNEAPEIQIKTNDVLMTKDGTIGKLLYIDYLPGPASLNSHLLVFRPHENLYHPKYLFYQLQSLPFKHFIGLNKSGTTFFGITQDAVSRYMTILPAYDEQMTIFRYLDRKTAQIDDIIAKKQRLIDLLNEEKTAIINQAVTKGLDPNTPMKDSGIPWLGEIPAHWEIRKLKYVSKINPEALTENTKEDFRFFYIDISSVDSEGNITDLIELLFKDAPSRARRIVKQEDTIISTVRTYLKAIAFIQREDSNLICSTGFSVIRPDPKVFRPKFLFCLLRSDKIINAISSLSKGVSYPAIDSEDLAEMATWFPPREEQDAILNYIEANKYRIDKTISKINKEIELLQEYRTALISEAVTGKIKVS